MIAFSFKGCKHIFKTATNIYTARLYPTASLENFAVGKESCKAENQ